MKIICILNNVKHLCFILLLAWEKHPFYKNDEKYIHVVIYSEYKREKYNNTFLCTYLIILNNIFDDNYVFIRALSLANFLFLG